MIKSQGVQSIGFNGKPDFCGAKPLPEDSALERKSFVAVWCQERNPSTFRSKANVEPLFVSPSLMIKHVTTRLAQRSCPEEMPSFVKLPFYLQR